MSFPIIKTENKSLKKYERELVSIDNIECYKIFKYINDNTNNLLPLYQDQLKRTTRFGIEEFTFIYNADIKKFLILRSFLKNETENKWINVGFHSYSDHETCKKEFDRLNSIKHKLNKYTYIIVKCIIPQNTKYYYNPINKQYVSLTIKLIGKVLC